MSDLAETTRPTLAELTTEQPDSTDRDYLAWVEQQIAEEQQQQMKDPVKGIPAEQVWEAFDLKY